jgi:2,3-bisphosphoglycerate-independent phosphoglycerate mutase
LTYHISGQDPLVDNKPLPKVVATMDTEKAHFTAELVQKFSETIRETLRNHPINIERK